MTTSQTRHVISPSRRSHVLPHDRPVFSIRSFIRAYPKVTRTIAPCASNLRKTKRILSGLASPQVELHNPESDSESRQSWLGQTVELRDSFRKGRERERDRKQREYRGKRRVGGERTNAVRDGGVREKEGGKGRERGRGRTLSRVPGTVLADRFPANNWKCKRNRPPCDSSIIESLISV